MGEVTGSCHARRVHGLLGTVVDVTVDAATEAAAVGASGRLLAEVERLQAVFDVFDASSEVSAWVDGRGMPGPELVDVLALAAQWHRRTRGAFNPQVMSLVRRWQAAADEDRWPPNDELRELATRIATPGWVDHEDRPVTPPPLPVDLNALAKGWIVDRALATALDHDDTIERVVVNAGGDLRHHGSDPPIVGIEDPKRRWDNAPPMASIALDGRALATSGGARRGWTIAGRRASHVLDPRTGRPTGHVASASVVADDAATADVLATVLAIVDPVEGLGLVEDVAGAACLVVMQDSEPWTSRRWDRLAAPVRSA